LNEHKLDQQIAKWIEELARWQKEDPHGLFERLRQQQRENQQTLLDLKELGKSLEQARSQLIHLQDTAEQRQRAAIADWQKGYEKRWSDYLAREERRREEPTKQEKALMAQIKELETLVRTQGTKLAALQQSAIEERRRRLAETEEFDQSKK
jgi:hypothetical protein